MKKLNSTPWLKLAQSKADCLFLRDFLRNLQMESVLNSFDGVDFFGTCKYSTAMSLELAFQTGFKSFRSISEIDLSYICAVCVELMTEWVLSKVSVPVQFKWGKFNWKLSNLGLLLPYFELLNLLSWQKQFYLFLSQFPVMAEGKGYFANAQQERQVGSCNVNQGLKG